MKIKHHGWGITENRYKNGNDGMKFISGPIGTFNSETKLVFDGGMIDGLCFRLGVTGIFSYRSRSEFGNVGGADRVDTDEGLTRRLGGARAFGHGLRRHAEGYSVFVCSGKDELVGLGLGKAGLGLRLVAQTRVLMGMKTTFMGLMDLGPVLLSLY